MAVPLLLLELTLRLAGPILPGFYRTGTELISDSELGYFHRANYRGWRKTPEFTVRIETNSQGLRDREISYAKPNGVRRVFVLGDSFVEALNVNADESVSSRMERDLNDRDRPTEVINGGVGGYGTSQELLLFEQRAYRYDPDLVVLVFYIGNDVRNNSSELDHIARIEDGRYFTIDTAGVLLPVDIPPAPSGQKQRSAAAALLGDSILFNVIETGVFEKLYADDEAAEFGYTVGANDQVYRRQYNARWEKAWKITAALLARLKNSVEAGGARFLLVLAPSDYQVRPSDWAQALAKNKQSADQFELEKPNRLLHEIAQSINAPVIDLLPALRAAQASSAAPLYYQNNRHWTPMGHDLVAKMIADYIGARGGLPD